MEKSLRYPARYRRDSLTIRRLLVLIAVAVILTTASVVATAQQSTFTKWVTTAPAMAGVVGGACGNGTYAGEILKYTEGPTTVIEALYHFNGSKHVFSALVHVEQTGMKAVIIGAVTEGWMKGNQVQGEYTQITSKQSPNGNAFQGTLDIMGGSPAAALPRSHRYNLTGESLGLVGYDPVAYFPEGGGHPKKGLFKLSFEFDGVTYRFATQENLDRFKVAPSKYLPQYGGWCSYGAAVNGRFDVDPESFVIRDGKLYLFHRDPGFSGREVWLKDPESMLQKSEANWPGLSRD